MEAAAADEEPEPPAMLFDSGSESYSDSPILEEEGNSTCCVDYTPNTFNLITCQSYETSDLPVASSTCNVRRRTLIIDRSISVDEDILVVPLKPVHACYNTNHDSMSCEDESSISSSTSPPKVTDFTLVSILRPNSSYDGHAADLLDLQIANTERAVHFPEQEHILANYRAPDAYTTFKLTEIYYSNEILDEYHRSCVKHRAEEFDTIKAQLAEIKHNTNRSAVFNLANIHVTMEVCETFEDLFRVTNFHSISLKDSQFTAESIREFVNMLEYYNCAAELVLSDLFVEPDNFKVFCTVVSKMLSLESLCFQSMNINDQQVRALLQNIKINENINTVKFDRCHFDVVLLFNTGDFVKNDNIRELYLPHSSIYAREADFLSKYLMVNRQLRVLDISNNPLGDRGLDALARSLCPSDISVLIIFNDQLTEKSGSTINNIVIACTQLHTLNIGFNNLTDQVIEAFSPGLEQTMTLEGLGLQQTLLTCRGATALAAVVQKNKSLQKINLKCNKGIQVEGLEKLCQALTNTKILKIEIDDANRNCHDCTRYAELVQNLNGICLVNQSMSETDAELTTLLWRKVSLNCEPIYMPSVEPLTVANPITETPTSSPIIRIGRTRFSIVKVPSASPTTSYCSDNSQQMVNGRFRVSPTYCAATGLLGYSRDSASSSPSPSVTDDDDTSADTHKPFQNVRSSVSSNSIDSVDSVQIGDVCQSADGASRDSLLFDSSAPPSCDSD